MASYYDIFEDPRENLLIRSRTPFGGKPEVQFIDTASDECWLGLSVEQARELHAELGRWLSRQTNRKAA